VFGFPPETSRTSINVAYQFGYLRCLCGFILGMTMYYAYQLEWGKKVLSNGYVMVLLGLGVFLSMHFYVTDLFPVAFFPFILLSGAYGSPAINRFFAAKPLQKLGDWSFSIYLVHQPLIITILNIFLYINSPKPGDPPASQQVPPPVLYAWMICLGVIALVLLLSYITYRFWEVPARKWINAKAERDAVPVEVNQ
jgi:peptidoglycan/LPS O-acetylase OafA/YrhL